MSPSFIHAQATLLLRPETFQSETTPPTVFIADMLLLELTHTNSILPSPNMSLPPLTVPEFQVEQDSDETQGETHTSQNLWVHQKFRVACQQQSCSR